MIELENVTKFFRTNKGRNYLFRDLTYTVPENSNVALLGRNGTGKSTLMRMIAGNETPNGGRIRRDCSVSWPLGLAGGFQGSMTAVENVRFVCRIHGLSTVEANEVVDFVTDFAEIGDYMEMPTKTYSNGMRARVVFGMSLALKFDVYLVDELTAVGDVQFRKKAGEAFQELRKRSSIIFASHDLKSVQKFCDRAIVLYDKRVHFFEDVGSAVASYTHWVNIKATGKLERRPAPEKAKLDAQQAR